MKKGTIFIILIISILFNLTFIWNNYNSNGPFNKQNLVNDFGVMKGSISGGNLFLQNALKAEDAMTRYKEINGAKEWISRASLKGDMLESLVQAKYYVRIHNFVSHLYNFSFQLAYFQERMLSGDQIQDLNEEDLKRLQGLANDFEKLFNQTKEKTFNLKDLRSLNSITLD